jgi:hypothetical protein
MRLRLEQRGPTTIVIANIDCDECYGRSTVINTMRSERAPYEARGLGRLVEPDTRMRAPSLHPWARAQQHADGFGVTVCWVRDVVEGLHSIVVEYANDAVRIGLNIGTRPGFWGVEGLVVLNVVVEHTIVHLREPIGGRRVEMLL